MNALQVTLTDGTSLTVHEPKAKDSSAVLTAFLPMMKLKHDAKGHVNVTDLIEQVMVEPEQVARLMRVVALCADITDDEAGELGLSDFYGVLWSAFTLSQGGGTPLPKKKASSSRATKPE